MMQGKAHWVNQDGSHTQLSHCQVLKHWNFLPFRYENYVRILGWLKEATLYPEDHKQLIAACFS